MWCAQVGSCCGAFRAQSKDSCGWCSTSAAVEAETHISCTTRTSVLTNGDDWVIFHGITKELQLLLFCFPVSFSSTLPFRRYRLPLGDVIVNVVLSKVRSAPYTLQTTFWLRQNCALHFEQQQQHQCDAVMQ